MPNRPKMFRPSSVLPRVPDRAKVERDEFYTRRPWRMLRDSFLKANPLCADCEARDVATPATVVHHKQERLQRPDLALDWDNLESLCSPCHTRLHKATPGGASEV